MKASKVEFRVNWNHNNDARSAVYSAANWGSVGAAEGAAIRFARVLAAGESGDGNTSVTGLEVIRRDNPLAEGRAIPF